jgi:predicted RNase H-like HicB family nuclease
MTAYIALARKEKASDIGVEFPDFPGCVTAAVTLDAARRMASEALELHINGLVEDGTAIPDPSPLDQIMVDPENRDAVAFLVEAVTSPHRSVSVSVALPEELVVAIDRASPDRSRFLADAARAKLEQA